MPPLVGLPSVFHSTCDKLFSVATIARDNYYVVSAVLKPCCDFPQIRINYRIHPFVCVFESACVRVCVCVCVSLSLSLARSLARSLTRAGICIDTLEMHCNKQPTENASCNVFRPESTKPVGGGDRLNANRYIIQQHNFTRCSLQTSRIKSYQILQVRKDWGGGGG